MTLRVPNEGEDRLIGIMLGKYTQENFSVHLFTSNTTPADTDTVATYTEASGFGYASVTLTASNWTITQGAPTEAAYPQITWTFTGALGNVYGYFIKSVTSGKLIVAERFTDGPYNIAVNGETIKVTPKITMADTLD